jgi:hypothetical protein
MKKKNNQMYFCLVLLAFILSANIIFAQDNTNEKKARLESQKVGFITNKLDLSVSEAQKFWPVYNEFQQKKQEIFKTRKQMFESLKDKNQQLSNEELTKISDQYIQSQMDESKLSAEYHNRFKQVLPVEKVIRYYWAEEQFKVWLLNEVKNKEGKKPDKK